LRKRFPNIRLLIAGDGKFRRYLEDIVRRREMEDCITFLGNVDFIPELLALSDIYVHMALNEGCPHSVIESMRAKKPIIAANRGGIPEILENDVTGLLIEPDAERLAEAVERLVVNKRETESLAQKASEYASANLTWEIIAKRYLAVYQGDASV
jgi:glycosyltransferase involved in cell wall biosynthesis